MTYHEAEKAYKAYLKRIRNLVYPPPPPRAVLRALRKHDAEVREYEEYLRLKAKYG